VSLPEAVTWIWGVWKRIAGVNIGPKVEKVTGGWRKLHHEKVRGDLSGSGGRAPRIPNLDSR
jgi:hypothetical protein